MVLLYGEEHEESKGENVMCDDADLPDHDYESIYGHTAMHARTLARLDAIAKRMEAQAAQWHAARAAFDATYQKESSEEA
jgi:hypothetical protein